MDQELQDEEFHFSPSRSANDVILATCFHFHPTFGCPVFEFKNKVRTFLLAIAVSDINALGWKECQAIVDGMAIASRGTKINDAIFSSVIAQAASKYGKVEGPDNLGAALYAIIYPNSGTHDQRGEHTINRVSMYFDADQDLVFQAATTAGNTYKVYLQLLRKEGYFSVLDCEAFCDIFPALETGDVLRPRQFLALGAVLYLKYNHVNVKVSENGSTYSLTVLASRVQSKKPMDNILNEALNEIKHELESNEGQSTTEVSPYPGVTYKRVIKEGGQGKVFAARSEGRAVAVKVFNEPHDPLGSYKTELKLLLKMSRHPNVVDVLDFFETPRPALVMRLIEGVDLAEHLKINGAFENKEGRKLAIGIAEGICHLHQHGIIHRDLKSPNIIYKNNGSPVIVDLGLGSVIRRTEGSSSGYSTEISELVQKTSGMKGSPPWMAPEMIVENTWSEKTDVYAFGIILWEIFSGQRPFVDSKASGMTTLNMIVRIASGERPPVSVAAKADPELKSLMQVCWAADPKERPTMKLVLDQLKGNDPREIFKEADKDGDGELNYPEFVTFLEKYAPGRVEISRMHVLFDAINENDSGSICFAEFHSFWRQVQFLGFDRAVSTARESAELVRGLSDTRLS